MSDRIAVMSDGRVEQIGSPQEIYNSPASLFVAGFIGSANLLPGEVVSSDGDETVVALSSGSTIRSRTSAPRHHGQPVSVMLRPERLTASADELPDGRSVEGTVADVVFQGPTARLIVHLADGSEVIANVPTGADLPSVHPGTTIHLSWNPGAAFLLSGWPMRPGATATDIAALEAQADS